MEIIHSIYDGKLSWWRYFVFYLFERFCEPYLLPNNSKIEPIKKDGIRIGGSCISMGNEPFKRYGIYSNKNNNPRPKG